MAELDLIPRDYVEVRRIRGWLRNFGVALALVALAAGGGRAWISLRSGAEQPIVASMQQKAKAAIDRKAHLLELETRKSLLQARLAMLGKFRDNATWVAMFVVIDQAYNPKLWFDELAFARTIKVAAPPQTAANGTAGESPSMGTAVAAMFDVKGHALDHAAMTDFMRALGEQPGVGTVRLVDTGLRRYSTMEVVDFGIAATLDPDRGRAP